MLSTLKIRVKILAFWSLFLLSSIFLNFWRLELPNITGTATPWGAVFTSGSGALYRAPGSTNENGSVGNSGLLGFDASKSNTLYSDDIKTVQPNANQLLIIIKA